MATIGWGYKPKPATPQTPPIDPYGSLPEQTPYDNSWYEGGLWKLDNQADRASETAQRYARQSAADYAEFMRKYLAQRQMGQPRPRLSRMHMLAGY